MTNLYNRNHTQQILFVVFALICSLVVAETPSVPTDAPSKEIAFLSAYAGTWVFQTDSDSVYTETRHTTETGSWTGSFTTDGKAFEIVGVNNTSNHSSRFTWTLFYDTTMKSLSARVSSPMTTDEHYSVDWNPDSSTLRMYQFNPILNLYLERSIMLTDEKSYIMTGNVKDASENILVSIRSTGRIAEHSPPAGRGEAPRP